MDDRSHIRFDRQLNDRSSSRLPSSTKRRIEYSIRTAITTLICIILSSLWPLGGVANYISPTLSPVSAVLYLGLWQLNIWKVIYSVVIGAALGVALGYLENYPAAHTVCTFLALVFSNRCSAWDHSAKVFASLSIIMGSLWPLISHGVLSGWTAYRLNLWVILFPFFITGFTLLFPFPALAMTGSRRLLERICQKISIVTTATLRAFGAHDYLDLYSAEIDHLQTEVRDSLESLAMLTSYCECEVILFPSAKDMPVKMKRFIEYAKMILNELTSLRDMLHNIVQNHTQEKFVEALQPILETIGLETTIALRLLYEDIADVDTIMYPFHMLPKGIIDAWVRFMTRLSPHKDNRYRSLSGARNRHDSADGSFLWEHSDVLMGRRHLDTDAFDAERAIPLPESTKQYTSKLEMLKDVLDKLRVAKLELLTNFRLTRKRYVWQKPEVFAELCKSSQFRLVFQFLRSKQSEGADAQNSELSGDNEVFNLFNESVDQDLKTLLEENQTLRNLNPRGAYIQRVICLMQTINDMEHIMHMRGKPWNIVEFLSRSFTFFFMYIYTGVRDILHNAMNIFHRVIRYTRETIECVRLRYNGISTNTPTFIEPTDIDYMRLLLRNYSQSIKIAFAITLTSLLVIIKSLRDEYQNGLWATVVIALIRQETTSSSFLVGYQRLEGTVIGAVYAFALYQACGCSHNTCGLGVTIPVIVPWLALCAFFREGPRHGYAAIVAGFTPIVLFLGKTTMNMNGAWLRVEKTFIGIAVYLLVDNCILPNRTDTAIRASTLKIIDDTQNLVRESLAAVNCLINDKYEFLTQLCLPYDLPRDPSNRGFVGESPSNLASTPVIVTDDVIPSDDGQIQLETLSLAMGVSELRESEHSSEKTLDEVQAEREMRHVRVSGYNSIQQVDKLEGNLKSDSSEDSFKSSAVSKSDASSKSQERPDALLMKAIMQIRIKKCIEHLDSAEIVLATLTDNINKQVGNLKLVIHEPEIWHRPFPITAYASLLDGFKHILKSGRALVTGTRVLQSVLHSMIDEHEDVMRQLGAFSYMSHEVLEITSRVVSALQLTSVGLHRLYEDNDVQTDLSAIITLSKFLDHLLVKIDDHFKLVYASRANAIEFNIQFLVAWQNVFEGVCDLVKNLSKLGISLHTVRDVEALSAL